MKKVNMACGTTCVPSFAIQPFSTSTGPTGPPGITVPTYAFQAVLSHATAVAGSTTVTPLIFNVSRAGSPAQNAAYSPITGAFVAPRSGYYYFDVCVNYLLGAAGITVTTSLLVNGISVTQESTTSAVAASASTNFTSVLFLFSGDVLQLFHQGTSANYTIYSSPNALGSNTWLSCWSLF